MLDRATVFAKGKTKKKYTEEVMLFVSPTAKHWISWLTFINVGTAGHGIVIFDLPSQ